MKIKVRSLVHITGLASKPEIAPYTVFEIDKGVDLDRLVKVNAVQIYKKGDKEEIRFTPQISPPPEVIGEAEPIKVEPIKVEPIKVEPIEVEPIKSEQKKKK